MVIVEFCNYKYKRILYFIVVTINLYFCLLSRYHRMEREGEGVQQNLDGGY